jgi:hypothetical protein
MCFCGTLGRIGHLRSGSVLSSFGDCLHLMRHYHVSSECCSRKLHQLSSRKLLPYDGSFGGDSLPCGKHLCRWRTFGRIKFLCCGSVLGSFGNRLCKLRSGAICIEFRTGFMRNLLLVWDLLGRRCQRVLKLRGGYILRYPDAKRYDRWYCVWGHWRWGIFI